MKPMTFAVVLIATLLAAPIMPAHAQVEQDNQITEGKKVVIEFTIILPEENAVIPKNIAQYVQGRHELLPALEEALVGLKPGESKRVELPADRAFGPYDERKKKTVTRAELPSDLEPGAVLQTDDGQPFTVVEVQGSEAVIDYNHPLAGKHLVFDVKVLQVERPS